MRGSSALLNASSHTPSVLPAGVSGIIDGDGDGDGAGVGGIACVGGATEAGAAALPPPHAPVRATTKKMRFMKSPEMNAGGDHVTEELEDGTALRKQYWNVRCSRARSRGRFACDACDACDE